MRSAVRSLQVFRARPIELLRSGLSGGVSRAIGANGSYLLVNLLVQLLTVPVFLGTVGPEQYGDWLVLTAIPAYLSLSDFGFSGASATAATYAMVDSRPEDARRIVSSAWATVTFSALVLLSAIISISGLVIRESSFPGLDGDAHVILILQVLWAAAWMQIGFVEVAFRVANEYPRGMLYLVTLRVCEFVGLVVVLLISRSLIQVACTLLVVRIVGGIAIYRSARRRLAWFSLSMRYASWQESRKLAAPSLTYSGFVFGYAIVNQGILLLVGGLLGHVVVVTFATVRTMTNSLQQVMTVVTGGSLANLTKAVAEGAVERARAIQRSVYMIALIPAVAGGLVIAVFGGWITRIWTNGVVVADAGLLVLMVLTTIADIPWQVGANMLRARNAHQLAGSFFVVACGLALLTAWIILPYEGLIGVPLALFVIDAIMIPVVVISARRSGFFRTVPEQGTGM